MIKKFPALCAAMALSAPMAISADDGHGGATLQTQGSASSAAAGEFGLSVDTSALISVVAAGSNGKPASNLGSSVGDGTTEIVLPRGWSLVNGFNVPPGGCGLTPTEFVNEGAGVYTIRVVPDIDSVGCTWLSGEYHYAVILGKHGNGHHSHKKGGKKRGGGHGNGHGHRIRGSTLGSIGIP